MDGSGKAMPFPRKKFGPPFFENINSIAVIGFWPFEALKKLQQKFTKVLWTLEFWFSLSNGRKFAGFEA